MMMMMMTVMMMMIMMMMMIRNLRMGYRGMLWIDIARSADSATQGKDEATITELDDQEYEEEEEEEEDFST